MTQEDKELLLRDLCARLPYGVKVYGNYRYSNGDKIVDDERVEVLNLSTLDWFINGIEIKPYLRPMSSMTEEEKKDWRGKVLMSPKTVFSDEMDILYDFCNEHHLDYRGMIEKGLAIKVTEENNPYEN